MHYKHKGKKVEYLIRVKKLHIFSQSPSIEILIRLDLFWIIVLFPKRNCKLHRSRKICVRCKVDKSCSPAHQCLQDKMLWTAQAHSKGGVPKRSNQANMHYYAPYCYSMSKVNSSNQLKASFSSILKNSSFSILSQNVFHLIDQEESTMLNCTV